MIPDKEKKVQEQSEDVSEVRKLLKNLHTGLKSKSLKEINDSLESILYKGENENDLIECVFDIVKEHYGYSKAVLKKKSRLRNIVEAKQMAYCLMHFKLGLSCDYISAHVFNNWKNSVQYGIDRLKNADEKIKEDARWISIYEKLQLKLTEFIKNK